MPKGLRCDGQGKLKLPSHLERPMADAKLPADGEVVLMQIARSSRRTMPAIVNSLTLFAQTTSISIAATQEPQHPAQDHLGPAIEQIRAWFFANPGTALGTLATVVLGVVALKFQYDKLRWEKEEAATRELRALMRMRPDIDYSDEPIPAIGDAVSIAVRLHLQPRRTTHRHQAHSLDRSARCPSLSRRPDTQSRSETWSVRHACHTTHTRSRVWVHEDRTVARSLPKGTNIRDQFCLKNVAGRRPCHRRTLSRRCTKVVQT